MVSIERPAENRLDFSSFQRCNTRQRDFSDNKIRHGRLKCWNISALRKVIRAPCTTVKRHHDKNILHFLSWLYKYETPACARESGRDRPHLCMRFLSFGKFPAKYRKVGIKR